ncbi:MAG: hypothetical protein HY853_01795 [Burkholderiales bacterium]|nr:hypothetical protein [Burkholderiales bacterium]
MRPDSRLPKPRQVARTVLLVGEGDAEVQFMQHLKGMYVQRGSGVVVTIKETKSMQAQLRVSSSSPPSRRSLPGCTHARQATRIPQ